ncbi:dehydrogenase [Bacteroidetes bacterium UKL13-3]|jgi:glycolate oxidase|nr:dehydrogenase [Bacteroidetes bacterium UKL13-3]HCP94062.1 FAD-binding oxidoreductase [Bacteroidota bacterium]
MQYNKVTASQIKQFQSIVGQSFVITSKEETHEYSRDYTEDLEYYPDVVVKPRTAEEVAAIVKICNDANIALTPRGAGTGLSGGALPFYAGVVLSMERFNKILEIDERNFQATVEPGVINEAFQNAVREKGLFYPPDPASKGSCFLGGNVAHASGGPRALKYGTTRDYVLNLQVVLPTGEIIWTGANTLKYSTGYNLTHLMIGSEGTLGIVTQIVLKLIPHPQHTLLMLAPFNSPEKACEAVNGIFLAGTNPSACEFVEPEGFLLSAAMTNLSFTVEEGVEAYLLIEVDGNDLDAMMKECEVISEVLYKHESGEVLFAQTADEKEYFWKLRRSIGEATKFNNTYKEEDTVVPRAELPALFRGVKEIGMRYGFRTVCYGHAGDGNLHVNILKDELTDDFWGIDIHQAIIEIFTLCKKLKGTISGEHGIGLVQKPYMHVVMPEFQLELMRNIKKAFDPKGILNPGKIF